MIMCMHTCTMKGLGWVGLHVRHFVEIMNERERGGGQVVMIYVHIVYVIRWLYVNL